MDDAAASNPHERAVPLTARSSRFWPIAPEQRSTHARGPIVRRLSATVILMPAPPSPVGFDETKHPRGQPKNRGQFKSKPAPTPPRATLRGRRGGSGAASQPGGSSSVGAVMPGADLAEGFELSEQVLDREATLWRLSADCSGCGAHWQEDHTRDPPDLSDVLHHEAEERRSDWMRQHICEPLTASAVALGDVTLVQADVAIKMGQERIRRARRLGGWLPWGRRDLREADELLRGSRACIERELEKKRATNPRVRITDWEVLTSLNPGSLRAYVRAHGWHERGKLSSGVGVWGLQVEDDLYEVLTPVTAEHRDYAVTASELLRTLSIVEDRSELDILHDIEALIPHG